MKDGPFSESGRWTRWFQERPGLLAAWSVVAAFGTYGCMYGFRKPFTAAGYEHAPFGPGIKALLVLSQILGYTASKWIGIRVIAELPAHRRASLLLALVGIAEVALVVFGLVPFPAGCALLFVNGLALGLVFGLVLGFLEGRRLTEAFIAGLCASFILADGFTKSAGAVLLRAGVPERWMPSVCGLFFLGPLFLFVWMLRKIPAPSDADMAARSRRVPMDRAERRAVLMKHAPGLLAIVVTYVLVTILRSLRADFAPELWSGLGSVGAPSVFTTSELWVAVGVLVVTGLGTRIRNNRTALLVSLGISGAGLAMVGAVVVAHWAGRMGPFPFMVLLGLGLYLPYVAIHTTVFERLIALTRDRANVGHLMYVADAAGYLGYLGVVLCKWRGFGGPGILPLFLGFAGICAVAGIAALLFGALWFSRLRQGVHGSPVDSDAGAAGD